MKLDSQSLLELLDNDDVAYREVLLMFVDSSESIIAEIKHHSSSLNVPGLNKEAHKLKSAARSIGAVDLGEICEKLELITSEENGEANAIVITTNVDTLLQHFANVKSHIGTLIEAE